MVGRVSEETLDSSAGGTRLSSLTPSLMADLQRFGSEAAGGALDILAMLAAAVRHGRALRAMVQVEQHAVPLTLFPTQRLAHSPLPMVTLLSGRVQDWRLLQVGPAQMSAPGAAELQSLAHNFTPLPLLLWAVSQRGSRETLLPEIAGTAAYRVTPSADLRLLDLTGTVLAAVERLRRNTTNLREIATWPGFDKGRAQRLLNGLYLQAALLVSRTHPAATNDSWAH
ncbi:MAG: hypothetical protein JNJ89_18420 [Rubrivivax sp.]|nr:hypothetical protein [Rubrivivax sp.]